MRAGAPITALRFTLVSFAALTALTPVALAAEGPAFEVITYAFEDFESYTPGLWCGRPEAKGRRWEETETVHGGKRAVALSWDFGECPDAAMSFANFVFHRRMAGHVQEVRVWIHAGEAARDARLVLWVSDPSREMYLSGARVDWTGWKQVTFPVASLPPAWISGDGNRRRDLPIEVFGLAVDYGGPDTGTIIIDDMEVVTKATPREGLALVPSTRRERNLFWNEHPAIVLPVRNHARTAVTNVVCRLRVEDLYRERDVQSIRVDLGTVPGQQIVERTQVLGVPHGVYRVHWQLADDGGELLTGTLDVSRMIPPCYRDAPLAVRDYERRWSLFGGVFGAIEPELASDMGARWVRYEDTVWSGYEKEPGQFDLSSLPDGLRRYRNAGIESIIFQTLYQRPGFHNPDQVTFAPAYGAVMRHVAEASRGLGNCFELGNEDNGPTKALYSEVARHGAAGIRSAQPHALIANSGTAFIDLGWLKMQASRGVMDWLDALCTHPYTVHNSAEAWDILGRLGEVNHLIDTVGGMKVQWTTEFGWHHTFSQRKRAEWIPRHFLIGAAAGVERHGLYTWARDYGIFQPTAQPPAASVHALAKMIEGHRFVGLLHHDEDLWACVWERAGTPLAIAWSPAGNATLSVDVTARTRVLDLFGNPRAGAAGNGRVTLDGGPTYVTDVAESVLAQAARNQCERERNRLRRCLQTAKLPPNTPLPSLVARADATAADVRLALSSWTPASSPISSREQAAVAQALRWYWTAGRLPGAPTSTTSAETLARQRRSLREHLATLVADDQDLPSLRYLLERWDRLADEERLARECGAPDYAARLTAMQEVLAIACARFVEHGQRKLLGIWPYLHTVAGDGVLRETLRFVPGEETVVGLRVNSYAGTDRQVTVSVQLPDGWRCRPELLELTARAGIGAQGEIAVTCPSDLVTDDPVLRCTLRVAGLPDCTVPFDDMVIEAPVRLALTPVAGLLPETPIRATLANPGARPVSGLLRLMRSGDTRALARAAFDGLSAGKPLTTELVLRHVAPLPHHHWPLTAQFLLKDGLRLERPVTVDFACAPRAGTAPVVDGDLGDWRNATPLHLNRAEYAKGSFGGKWSPQDLSAATYAMWDSRFFYFAAHVTDQTFNQTLSGTSQWIQDSIQFSLAKAPESPRTEIGLALTPRGEEVVSYTAKDPEVPGSRLKVSLHQGGATYEAAVPWQQIPALGEPRAGQTVRYAVLVNDDDAVTGRRFLERYGGIAHEKDIANFGYLTLLPDTGATVAEAEDGAVFVEDFEEYDDGGLPDAWEDVRHKQPWPETVVTAGAGRNGSKALVMRNTVGHKPYVYLQVVRPLTGVRPGERYELRCWMRGRGVEATGGIVGVCSDKYGNESCSYARHGNVDDAWREVVHPVSGPVGGRLNLIIRNHVRMDELAIDDLRVVCRGRPRP